MNVDEPTGEVLEAGTDVELVTLNLAGLNEAELLALFPTPVQCAGALLKARAAVTRAPAVLNEYRTALADRERDLTIALAKAARDLLADYPRMPMTERRDLARAEASAVREAQEARDTAWLLLQYAKDRKDSLFEDIGILRSLNANFRGEHR
ncbi:hypothetical protein ACTJI8_12950 [Microbacterium sp. 22303]|uniref:hypothetical protein n=1 Tax=Microbacterium sp. 22303 TaxID=3453905 RepID=UPI003F85E424